MTKSRKMNDTLCNSLSDKEIYKGQPRDQVFECPLRAGNRSSRQVMPVRSGQRKCGINRRAATTCLEQS